MKPIHMTAALMLAAITTSSALAQAWTTQSVRLVVPFEAGGTIDALGRVVAAQVQKQSGTSIFIDNKGGANSLLGTVDAARAAPDGNTVMNTSPSFVLNALLKAKLPYALDDFVPVTALGIGTGYLLVTRKELPVNSLDDLVKLAKAGTQLTYGTPGIGNAIHLATEAVAKRLGISMLHVPYKGSSSALNAIVAGQVDVMILSPATVIPLAAGNKLRVLAFTGEQRQKEFPQVATMRELGHADFVIKGTWVGWFVPKGTPAALVDKIHLEVARALRDPQVAATLIDGGFEPDGRPPAEFARFVKAEYQRFGEIIKSTGVPLQ